MTPTLIINSVKKIFSIRAQRADEVKNKNKTSEIDLLSTQIKCKIKTSTINRFDIPKFMVLLLTTQMDSNQTD